LHAQGATTFTIQTVLGHSQLSTTKRYTHVPIEVAKSALDGMESLMEGTRKKSEEQPEQKPEPQSQTTQIQ
jgi:hypothetical protein